MSNKATHQKDRTHSNPSHAKHHDSVAMLDEHQILRLQRKIGNQGTLQLLRQRQEARIQRLAYNQSPTGWGDVTLTRSGEGIKGVFFAKKDGKMVVVKPVDNPGNIAAGNDVMEAMGIEAPKMMTYTKKSSEGKALTALLMKNLGIGRTVKKDGKDVDEIIVQLDEATHFVVMNAVQGKSIQTSSDDELHEYFTNPTALETTGRMIAGDGYMGNTDRILTSGKPNLGNYFFQSNGFDGNIASIDNEAKFNDNGLGNRINLLKDLFDPKWRDNIITTFVASTYAWAVKAGKTKAAAVIDPKGMTFDLVKTFIDLGITNGFNMLAQAASGKMATIRSVGKKAGNLSMAKGVALYVLSRVNGDSHSAAKDKLDKYMDYRDRRDKMPSGLKWTSKIGSDRGF